MFCLQVDDRDFVVDVIDSVEDYLLLMKEIFNFDKLKTLLQGSNTRPPFKVLINSMHGGKVKCSNMIVAKYNFCTGKDYKENENMAYGGSVALIKMT